MEHLSHSLTHRGSQKGIGTKFLRTKLIGESPLCFCVSNLLHSELFLPDKAVGQNRWVRDVPDLDFPFLIQPRRRTGQRVQLLYYRARRRANCWPPRVQRCVLAVLGAFAVRPPLPTSSAHLRFSTALPGPTRHHPDSRAQSLTSPPPLPQTGTCSLSQSPGTWLPHEAGLSGGGFTNQHQLCPPAFHAQAGDYCSRSQPGALDARTNCLAHTHLTSAPSHPAPRHSHGDGSILDLNFPGCAPLPSPRSLCTVPCAPYLAPATPGRGWRCSPSLRRQWW